MDINSLPVSLKFVTLAMFKSAITFKEMGKTKKEFKAFSNGIWESMEMNNLEELKDIINGQMKKDIDPYVKDYIRRNGE